MAETKALPNNLEGWLEYLGARKLPSALPHAKDCLAQMSNTSPSYQALAKTLSNDPVVAFSILQTANKNPRPTAVFSKTLDHAMSMLGHEQLKLLLTHVQKLPQQYGYRAYFQAQSASLTRAALAQKLVQLKQPQKAQEVFWGSLFSEVADWYIWCYATPIMREIQSATTTQQTKLYERHFGCDINTLRHALLVSLGAPALSLQSLNQQHCLSALDWVQLSHADGPTKQNDLPNSLKIARQHSLFFIELSRFYLHYYDINRTPKQRSRAMSVAAGGLQLEPDQAHTLVTQTLLDIARANKMPFSNPRINLVFENLRESAPDAPSPDHKAPPAKHAELSQAKTQTEDISTEPATKALLNDSASTDNATPQPTTPPSSIEVQQGELNIPEKTIFSPEPSFMALFKRIKNAPTDFDSAGSLMQEVATQVQKGLRLERCVMYVLNKDKSGIKPYFRSGIDKSDPLYSFETQIIKGTIFKVLTDKPGALWLKPSSKQQVANLVPINFKQCSQRDESLFASIFVRGKAVAVLYADNALKVQIDEGQFRYFKHISAGLEKALSLRGG